MRRVSPLLAVLVLGAGCTFPEVTIDDQFEAGAPDGTVSDAHTDGADADVKVDSISSEADAPGFDTDPPDTAPEDVFVQPTDAPPDFGPDAPVCDIDRDGYKPVGGVCAPDPGQKADCDDLNPSANPGLPATTYFHVKSPDTLVPAGDWNCDGRVDKEYTVVASCPGLSVGCVARSGVDVVTECGESLQIVTCAVDTILGCKVGSTTAAKQGCH